MGGREGKGKRVGDGRVAGMAMLGVGYAHRVERRGVQSMSWTLKGEKGPRKGERCTRGVVRHSV